VEILFSSGSTAAWYSVNVHTCDTSQTPRHKTAVAVFAEHVSVYVADFQTAVIGNTTTQTSRIDDCAATD